MIFSPEISFVIPVYNEEEVFDLLIKRLDELVSKIDSPCEVVLIDDGSVDNTPALIENIAVQNGHYQAIFLTRNFGHQRALSAGLEHARGDVLMILDGDLQDPPELFFKFYDYIKKGYDVVYGVRKERKESVLKRASYNLFYKILNKISNYPIPKDSGDFGMITRQVVNNMNRMQEESRFLRGIRSWVGCKKIGIPYERKERAAGVPKYSFKMLFKLAYDGIFNFSVFPIKVLTYLGVVCISVSAFYFLLTLVKRMFYQSVPSGFTALLFMILLFGGVQLLSIGIIGEYVQRIFFQVKNRPLYLISRKIVNRNTVSG